MTPPLPDFKQPDLARAVEALSEEAIDALPFGVIRLDAEGVVRFYNETERLQSGSGDRPRLGRHFFSQVAPCMDTPGYRGRIDAALARGTLDLEFTHVGDFDDPDRDISVRAQSATGGGAWIFMRRGD